MKNIKRIAAVLLVLVMALALTACGKVKLDGKWKVTGGSLIDGLLSETGVDSMEAIGMELTYEFKDDNVIISTVTLLGSSESNEGTYEIEDDKILITFDGETNDFFFELENDTLTIFEDDYSLIFEKMN